MEHSMSNIQPSTLTYSELLHYAQMYIDRKESLPLAWQEELIKRAYKQLDDNR
jgi:hypothetical protein